MDRLRLLDRRRLVMLFVTMIRQTKYFSKELIKNLMSDRIDLFDNVAEVLKRGISPFSCIDQMSKQITPHVTIKTRIATSCRDPKITPER